MNIIYPKELKSKREKDMVPSETKCKQKLITKNEHLIVRVEEGWKRKVKSISESIGVSTSVFIRESVNKNIESILH